VRKKLIWDNYVIFDDQLKENNRPRAENSPNLVTLILERGSLKNAGQQKTEVCSEQNF
jgi:hypothetical protein